MRRRKKKRDQNLLNIMQNDYTYIQIFNRLMEIAITCFVWENMPPEVDQRFLEYALAANGMAVFYKDEMADKFVGLTTTVGGNWNIYNIPSIRRAYATNGYHYDIDGKNSVLIFNNYLRTNILSDLNYFAMKLYNIQCTIDININAQKTPILILADESERITLENLYEEYNGNSPVIKGYKSNLNPDSLKVLKTDAPFLADKLQNMYLQVWSEALSYLGVVYNGYTKAERLITPEMDALTGNVFANRQGRLKARQQAAEQINDMFGLNLRVHFDESMGQQAVEPHPSTPESGGEA